MYKQIIIVRKDLHMSHGKMAAQVSHASMAFLTKMIQDHYIGPVFDNPFHGMKPLGLVAIDGLRWIREFMMNGLVGLLQSVSWKQKIKRSS